MKKLASELDIEHHVDASTREGLLGGTIVTNKYAFQSCSLLYYMSFRMLGLWHPHTCLRLFSVLHRLLVTIFCLFVLGALIYLTNLLEEGNTTKFASISNLLLILGSPLLYLYALYYLSTSTLFISTLRAAVTTSRAAVRRAGLGIGLAGLAVLAALTAFLVYTAVVLPHQALYRNMQGVWRPLLSTGIVVSLLCDVVLMQSIAVFTLQFRLVTIEVQGWVQTVNDNKVSYDEAVLGVERFHNIAQQLTARTQPAFLIVLFTVYLGTLLETSGALAFVMDPQMAPILRAAPYLQYYLLAGDLAVTLVLLWAAGMFVTAAQLSSACDELAPSVARLGHAAHCSEHSAKITALVAFTRLREVGVRLFGLRITMPFVLGVLSTTASLLLLLLRATVHRFSQL